MNSFLWTLSKHNAKGRDLLFLAKTMMKCFKKVQLCQRVRQSNRDGLEIRENCGCDGKVASSVPGPPGCLKVESSAQGALEQGPLFPPAVILN